MAFFETSPRVNPNLETTAHDGVRLSILVLCSYTCKNVLQTADI